MIERLVERAGDVLALPGDALIVLIGAAGCGKSTFAARRFLPTQIVSSDECRALVSDAEDDSRASGDAFALMHFIADKRLKRGRLTVADATNVTFEKRDALLSIARRHRRPAVAIVFDLPYQLCRERNARREGRRVPPQAVGGQFARLRASRPSLSSEGYSAVYLLLTAEAAEGAIVEVGERSRA